MIKWITIKYLERELENVLHNLISVELNQDIIENANDLHIKYSYQRKNIEETIEYLIN